MSERTDVSMWQRFLDRYVPVMQDLPSTLDLADGVGRTLPHPVQAADRAQPATSTVRALSAS
jgi:hypothetical protein